MNKLKASRLAISLTNNKVGKITSQTAAAGTNAGSDEGLNKSTKIIIALLVIIGTIIVSLQIAGITYYALTKDATNSSVNMDSLILKSDEITTLNGWTSTTKYKLLYRGSRDGFTATNFHSKCDGQSNTITVIKTTTDNVFGGFTTASWDSSYSYKIDANAFLFSLRLGGISNNFKSTITNINSAIYCHPNYGPTFGTSVPYHDIYIDSIINGNINHVCCLAYDCSRGTYYFNNGNFTFTTAEIEVFQKA